MIHISVSARRAIYGGTPTMELAHALQFTYTSVAQEIVCDTDAIADLSGTLDRLRANTAMIICGPSILRSSDVIRRVQEALGARCVGLFAGVAPHAPVPTLEEAIGVVREAQPEALVSVGGGSTHDTAKGIATLLAEGGDIHDYGIHFEPPDKVSIPSLTRPKIPILTIPPRWAGRNSAAALALRITGWGAKSLWLIQAPSRAASSSTVKLWRPPRPRS